MLFWAASITLS